MALGDENWRKAWAFGTSALYSFDLGKETIPGKDYILLPLWPADPLFSQNLKSSPDAGILKPSAEIGQKVLLKIPIKTVDELLQFKLQKVWTLVNLLNGKRAIGTKWVFRNKKDDRGIVIKNKERIEAIRLFLAYASFKDFVLYQMDVKSAFLYGKIEEKVYVCQPPGFEDPDFRYRSTVKAKTVNGEVQLQALVDGNKIIIIEASVRRDLQLEDAEGVDCLPNATIFEQLTLMGAKTTEWNEFSSTMASVIICLATNQKFNFSKYIFKGIHGEDLANLSSSLMYPTKVMANTTGIYITLLSYKGRFLNIQIGNPTNVADEAVTEEPSMQLKELMDFCTKLQQRVLDLENTKTTQAKEITSLKLRVKRLEKKVGSKTHKLKRLYKISRSARVVSSDEASLGDREDASKQGRKIDDIDVDDQRGEKRRGHDIAEKEVSTADPVTTAGEVVTNANVEVSTASSTATTINNVELTLAQTLAELKSARPKTKGVVMQEPSKSTPTISLQLPSQVKGSGSKDKGKAKMIEPDKPLKKKDQIKFDKELAFVDTSCLKLKANYQLAQRTASSSQEELSDDRKGYIIYMDTELVKECSRKLSKDKHKKAAPKRTGEVWNKKALEAKSVDVYKETEELKQYFTDVPDDDDTLAFPLSYKVLAFQLDHGKERDQDVKICHSPISKYHHQSLLKQKHKSLSEPQIINHYHKIKDDGIVSRLKFVRIGEDYQEYGLSIPEVMLNDAIKQSESYQMFIKYSTGQIPHKKSRGKGSQRKKIADDSQETVNVSEESKPEPVKRKTTSRRVVKKKVTIFTDDKIILEPNVALELGKSISLAEAEAEEEEAAKQVHATYARIMTESIPESAKKKTSSISSKSKLKGVQSLTPAEQEATDIMQALKESKKTSKRQPGIRGSSEGIGTIPGVPDESTVISATSGEGTESKYSKEDQLDDKEKDDKEGDADDEDNDHISDAKDTYDEDDKTESDEDEIYKYKIRVHKDEDEEMLNVEVEYSGKVGTVKDTIDAEINLLLDIKIQYEVLHIQYPSILRVPVSVISEPTVLTPVQETFSAAPVITLPLPSVSTIPPAPQQTTTPIPPPPIITDAPIITSVVPEFDALSAVQLRVAKLEKDVSELKKIDLSAKALADLKTQVPSVVYNYLGSKVGDLPKNQTPTVDLEQEYKKSPSDILMIKKEKAEKQKMPKFTMKSTDKAALKEFDQKSALYQTMHANKSFNRNPANHRLYHALMEALIEDKNAMDKGVADIVQDHKRNHDDNDDEDPPAGPNQGKQTKGRRTKESESSKKPSSTKETSKGKALYKGSKIGKSASAKEPVEEPIAEVVMDDAGEDVVRDDDQPQDTSEPRTAKSPNP
ncbi:retrovirus-related pol polyprotein from transposon TNT 1-94 [Tanacetum coccineum]